MCTDDDAELMSSRIRGKKFRPSTWRSAVAATESSNSSASSDRCTGARANASARARISFRSP
jgi:hypothetical protein